MHNKRMYSFYILSFYEFYQNKSLFTQIPISGSYPTALPVSYSKPVPLKSTWKENPPMPQLKPVMDEKKESNDKEKEDDELKEVERAWINAPSYPGQFIPPPTTDKAMQALADLKAILRPPRDSGKGGYKVLKLDQLLQSHLKKMSMFLWNYIDMSKRPNGWMGMSLKTAKAFQKGPWLAGRLREWTRAFINDHDDLPLNIYGTWNTSILEDEDFQQKLELHL